jgi:hypothetical protein
MGVHLSSVRSSSCHEASSTNRPRCPGNAQLGTDLAQGPALGVQIGCTLNVHGATVTILSRIGFALLVFLYEPDHVLDLVDDSLGVVVLDIVPARKDDVNGVGAAGQPDLLLVGVCSGLPGVGADHSDRNRGN